MKKWDLHHVVLGVLFVGLFAPFILIKTIYPFYRFGMFAEPVKTQTQKEVFEIFYWTQDSIKHSLKAKDIKMSEALLRSIVREYYYKNQKDIFLNEIGKIYNQHHKENAIRWEIVRR